MFQTILGITVGLALLAFLVRRYLASKAKRKAAPYKLFGEALHVLEDGEISEGLSVGSCRLIGRYNGLEAQAQTVVDTLNVRKLPSLWLMVTIADPLPVRTTFDLMMRPSGPSTFSKFDTLPHTIDLPPGFPEQAVIRTDDPLHVLPAHVIEPHLSLFFGPKAKELLISPKGLRMVLQIGEGDRLRYGVFRQAEFGEVRVEPELLRETLDRLMALRQDILEWST